MILFLTLIISLALSASESLERLSDDALRCPHGQQLSPILISAPCTSTCPTTTSMSVMLSNTVVGISSSSTATDTVPGPSATYTNLSITGTLFGNQICASQVNVADLNTLFMQSGYYANGRSYNILRGNSSAATTLGNELILAPADGVISDRFGFSVAMSGDGGSTVVIGAPNHSGGQGAIYIYQRQFNTWTLIQEIPDPTATGGDNFGRVVALSYNGLTVAVASLNGAGTVFLYQYSSATNQYVLSQTLAGTGPVFGNALSVSATGEYVAIANTATPAQVFIYVRADTCSTIGSSWILQQSLSGAGSGTLSSLSLSADTTTFAWGLPQPTGVGSLGFVEMFTRTGGVWNLAQTLVATDEAAGDNFGAAVALSSDGQYLLVGSPNHNAGAGEAYEFVVRGTFWNQENIFTSPVGGVLGFGTSVSLSADGTVGAIGAESGANTGNAFVVLRSPDNMWTTPFSYAGHTASALFGTSVSVSADGNFLIVGAPDSAGVTAGSASLFRPVSVTIPTDTIITGSLCIYGNMTVDSNLLVTGSIFVGGTVLTQAVTACVAPSDKRLKSDITTLEPFVGLRKLQLLEPVTFSWVNPEEHAQAGPRPAGFIAQKVEENFPKWIHYIAARGKDAALLPPGERLRLIGITPEIFAYVVAGLQAVDAQCTANTRALELLLT